MKKSRLLFTNLAKDNLVIENLLDNRLTKVGCAISPYLTPKFTYLELKYPNQLTYIIPEIKPNLTFSIIPLVDKFSLINSQNLIYKLFYKYSVKLLYSLIYRQYVYLLINSVKVWKVGSINYFLINKWLATIFYLLVIIMF